MAETQTVRQAPAEFIEAAGKTYLSDLQKAIGDFKTTDLGGLLGRQFVAGPGALTTQAEGLASGLGGFQPFLTQAEALTGPTAYQSYMSPFQQDVIDTTLAEFDRQAAAGLPALSAQAIQAGAFGGGREGVQRAEYQSASDRNRAALQAQLLGQGFTQAQNLAQQDFLRNINLAQQSPALVGQQIAGLTTLGGQQQARQQQLLAADQQLAQRQAFQPLEAAQTLGSGIVPLISGYPGTERTMTTPTPGALQTGLSTGATLAGIYRLIRG
jgi:hypothetical protein